MYINGQDRTCQQHVQIDGGPDLRIWEQTDEVSGQSGRFQMYIGITAVCCIARSTRHRQMDFCSSELMPQEIPLYEELWCGLLNAHCQLWELEEHENERQQAASAGAGRNLCEAGGCLQLCMGLGRSCSHMDHRRSARTAGTMRLMDVPEVPPVDLNNLLTMLPVTEEDWEADAAACYIHADSPAYNPIRHLISIPNLSPSLLLLQGCPLVPPPVLSVGSSRSCTAISEISCLRDRAMAF
ncbi:hypothetical protein DFH08DRAFT_823115 [Mycena albidolilacea]|uniref:Uncharacterized protein n=1 Tax=Mycena albidolilacea TaxID=1033008 RepID=A0AAD6Z6I2_9AGAR|nr:hypothetical protein DFH08DRAFT_823115 [Mycena albidolilacea]